MYWGSGWPERQTQGAMYMYHSSSIGQTRFFNAQCPKTGIKLGFRGEQGHQLQKLPPIGFQWIPRFAFVQEQTGPR
jgi:hypothetical protein